VRRDHFQSRRLADDGQVRLESALRQRAGAGLRVFLVNQSGKDDFGFQRTRLGSRQFAQCGEHGGDGTFRVARAAAVQPAVVALRNEPRSVCADGVQMRREQNGLLDFIFGAQPGEEIGAAWQNFLELHVQPGARGGGGEEIRDALFARAGDGAAAKRRGSRWAAR